ncbi:unnamed protein product [Penicillium bialowiezense]
MADKTEIFGPGNTAGRSFRDVLHGTSAAGQANGTQADNLPGIIKTQLFRTKPKPRLSSIDQWENWHTRIKSMLVSHRLYNVIDWSKPEPAPTDANAQRWYDASLAVKTWLMDCVDPKLIRALKARGKSIDFAHEFMSELTAIIHSESNNAAMQNAYFAIERCRRSDYMTITHYMAAMRRRLDTAQDLGLPITPWVVWVRILDELSKIPSLDSDLAFHRQYINQQEDLIDMTLVELSKLWSVIVNRGLDEETVINHQCCGGFHS